MRASFLMHKILIVDDEKPARDFIADLVTSVLPDSEITKADHPQKALTCLQREDFNMLFLDVCMPGMTGLEMLEKVNLKEKRPFTVIISAHREFDYAVKAMELGVVKYITKPLYRDKIYEAIRLYLKSIKMGTVELKVPAGIRRLRVEQIHAILTVDRTRVKVYTSDTLIPFVSGSLRTIYPLLPAYFRYIRRDCVLNYHAITDYNLKLNEVVILCQNEKITLKVSRKHMKELVTQVQRDGTGTSITTKK